MAFLVFVFVVLICRCVSSCRLIILPSIFCVYHSIVLPTVELEHELEQAAAVPNTEAEVDAEAAAGARDALLVNLRAERDDLISLLRSSEQVCLYCLH